MCEQVYSLPWHSMRVTLSDNGITNGIEMYQSPTAALHIATSNNDGKLRLFDAESAALLRCDRSTAPLQQLHTMLHPQDAGF